MRVPAKVFRRNSTGERRRRGAARVVTPASMEMRAEAVPLSRMRRPAAPGAIVKGVVDQRLRVERVWSPSRVTVALGEK
jgi:hypothetical protein